MTTSGRARLSLSPGEAIAPALERTARARGSERIRFRTTSGFLDRAVVGFEDLQARTYRHLETSWAAVICLDGEIDISNLEPAARIAVVVEDERGRRLCGRLLDGRVGPALDLELLDGEGVHTLGRRGG